MRISTTTLESYRLFMQPDQDWMPESELIATIQGKFTPTPAILLGQAFGRVLETPEAYQTLEGYVCGDYFFSHRMMGEPLGLIDRQGVFEAKGVKTYGDLDVVAKADHLLGAHLSEFKTTGSTFNFDKYAASCQWRFMVDIFETLKVTYHVFLLEDDGTGTVGLRGVESFNLYPYAALHQDCDTLVHAFADYVRAKGLDALLRARQAAA